MTEIEILKPFTDIFGSELANALEVFLVLVVLGIVPIVAYIVNQRRKPKIKITPNIHTKMLQDKMNVTFSITVKNVGKSVARNCLISVRYTGTNEKQYEHIPLSKRMLSLDWSDGWKKRRTIDLFREFKDGHVELPLQYNVYLNGKGFGGGQPAQPSYGGENFLLTDTHIEDENGNKFFYLKVIFIIIYNSKSVEKSFLIKIRHRPAPITTEDVTFTSVDIHS